MFLTGKLAERSLRRVLEAMQPVPFTYEVMNIGVSVAALMTMDMIARRLTDTRGANRIVVPGLCAGDPAALSEKLGVAVERGPEDLKDLPGYFGRGGRIAADLSRYDIQIFAEIVEAPRLSVAQILERAAAYSADGADVIDIGGLPGQAFGHLEETVQALKAAGYKLSVDSLETGELLRGGKAGADYLLSLKGSSLWIADEVGATPVLIPEQAGDLESLCRACERMQAQGRPFLADSVLDPIHFGFTDSIVRYHQLRERCPDIAIMMGIGNLTELTEVDTGGMTALLFGIMSELRVTAILTTQVSPHARTAVREADWARRIMYAAHEDMSLPKGYHSALLMLHDRKPFPYSAEEILEMAADIRDPSYRAQVSEQGVHVYNRDGAVLAQDPFDLFPQLGALKDDAPHAFYLGVELARAQIAWQLGKRYRQDEELRWGCATDEPDGEKKNDLHAYKAAGSTLQAKKKS